MPSPAQGQGGSDRRPLVAASSSLAVDYTLDYFQGTIDPWHTVALSAGHRTEKGSIIGRLNLANRFATSGVQIEADAYPSLGDHAYAYLNVGYSGSTIFPNWRSGGEVFASLPDALEASLGFRQLRFGGAPITLLTGSVGKYTGNYWFSLRPFVREKDTGLSASATLTVRRYYEDTNDYIGMRVGYGSTPTDRLTSVDLTRTSSASAGVHGSRTIRPRTFGTWSFGYDREELTPGRFRNRWELSGGLKFEY